MSEGNIAKWQLEEGAKFSAGDVLLEIETDKATMDVEAQDDGVLFKILKGDGEKGVKVGQRIAVLAEVDDDLGSLEVPEDDSNPMEAQAEAKEEEPQQKESQAEEQKQTSSISARTSEKPADNSNAPSQPASPPKDEPTTSPTAKPQKGATTYLPAVQQLLHQNGFHTSEADNITPTGPNGRLLKGDVLAWLGKINKEYPGQESKRIEKQSHLDLANITPVKPAPKGTPQGDAQAKSTAKEPEMPAETSLALPISLKAVLATQKRVQDSLGIWLPLSTFVARATELANENLPAPRRRTPTANDLFNAVVGLDRVNGPKVSRGNFIPQITGIAVPKPARAPGASRKKGGDIIDMLSSKPSKTSMPRLPVSPTPAAVGISADGNMFSVMARSGEEARAAEFLERMKLALETEPGRLVL